MLQRMAARLSILKDFFQGSLGSLPDPPSWQAVWYKATLVYGRADKPWLNYQWTANWACIHWAG